jgi:hypothetical protein
MMGAMGFFTAKRRKRGAKIGFGFGERWPMMDWE